MRFQVEFVLNWHYPTVMNGDIPVTLAKETKTQKCNEINESPTERSVFKHGLLIFNLAVR